MKNQADEIKRLVPISSLLNTHEKRIHCPVHKDKSPSCEVNHVEGLWNCFGCGEGGDQISLLMKRDRLSFKDALKQLADMAGVSLDNSKEAQQRWEAQQRQQAARRFAVDYYHAELLETQGGLNYLEGRGISLETMQKMKLGWSGEAKLTTVLAESMPEGLTIDDFIAAGLVARTADGNRLYDYFDTRIIFPLITRGKVFNVSGRVTDFSKDQKQKYKHLRGEDITCFYNEDALDKVIWLFEGHSDTLAGIEVGLPAVGVIGTSGMTRPDKLARCEEIYVCPDNDEAGKKAADKWAEAILHHNPSVKLYFVVLPGGCKDFNDWVCANRGKHLAEAFEVLRGAAKGLLDYKISQLGNSDDLVKVWPFIEALSDLQREGIYKKIKMQLPALGVTNLRKEFKTWKLNKDLAVLSDSSKIVEINFKPRSVNYLNVSFTFNSPATAHICLWGEVKRLDGDGKELLQSEPVLIRSTVIPEREGYEAEMVPVLDSGLQVTQSMIPEKSIVQGRWSDASVQRFLSGKAQPLPTSELVGKIAGLFRKYIWYGSEANYEILAFFILGTYVARLFEVYPYLVFNGLMATGKSNAMALLHRLCFNAVEAASSSVSSTYRSIESSFTTWIRDEAEDFNRKTPEREEEFTILNAGYKYGAKARRTGKNANGQMIQEEFDLFSPKVFGGINVLNPVLMSRGIVIKSHRAPREIVKQMPRMVQFRKQWEAEADALRDEIYTWTMTRFARVKEIFEGYPPVDEIVDREWEIWLPLLTLAFLADEETPAGADPENNFSRRMLAVAIDKGREKKQAKDEESFEIKVLELIVLLLADDQLCWANIDQPHWYAVTDITKKINESFKEQGYAKWDVSSRKLTRILEQTQVISNRLEQVKDIRTSGKTKLCVYLIQEAIQKAISNL